MLTHSGLLSETTSTADQAQLCATVPADTILGSDRGIKSQAKVKTFVTYHATQIKPGSPKDRTEGRKGGKKEGGKENTKRQKGRGHGS